MKRNVPMLILMAMLCAVFAVAIVGCAEEEEMPIDETITDPAPMGEVIEEVPDATVDAYEEDEEQEPGMEDLAPPTEEQIEQEPPIGDDDDAARTDDDM